MQTLNKPNIFVIFAVLAAVTIVTYGPLYKNNFIDFDDGGYVFENPHVVGGLKWQSIIWAFTTTHETNWHPLTWISHMIDCEFSELDPFWHHLTNLLFHVANALLLLWVLWKATGAILPSAFVAAAFALHPLNVESVAWVAERKNVLSTFFWLLTMIAYLRYAKSPGVARLLVVLFLFAMGFMAKPMLVTLPFVLLLFDYWPLDRFGVHQTQTVIDKKINGLSSIVYKKSKALMLVVEKIPLFILTAVFCVVTYLAQASAGAMSTIEGINLKLRLINATISYVSYIYKMFWPARLGIFYPYKQWWLLAWPLVTSGLILLCLTITVLLFWRRRPYLAVGWFWFIGTLVPVIGLVQVGQQSMADRYTYVPLIGLFIMIAWGIADYMKRRHQDKPVVITLAMVLLLSLAICTWRQVRFWQNTETLFRHTLKATGPNYLAYAKLGVEFLKQGKLETALKYCRQALPLSPDKAGIHTNIAHVLSKLGRQDDSIRHYLKALEFAPDSLMVRINYGTVLLAKQKYIEAVSLYEEILQTDPDNTTAHNNLGVALVKSHGDLDKAAKHFSRALRLKPDYSNAYFNLADVFLRQGKITKALAYYQRKLKLNPKDQRARKGLRKTIAQRKAEK